MEQAALLIRGDRHFDGVGSVRRDLDGVAQPLARPGPADAVTVGCVIPLLNVHLRVFAVVVTLVAGVVVAVGHSGRALVVVLGLDQTRNLVRRAAEGSRHLVRTGGFVCREFTEELDGKIGDINILAGSQIRIGAGGDADGNSLHPAVSVVSGHGIDTDTIQHVLTGLKFQQRPLWRLVRVRLCGKGQGFDVVVKGFLERVAPGAHRTGKNTASDDIDLRVEVRVGLDLADRPVLVTAFVDPFQLDSGRAGNRIERD